MRRMWLISIVAAVALTGSPGTAIPPLVLEPTEVGSFAVGSAPAAIGHYILGQRVFVGNSGSGTVSMIDEVFGDVTSTFVGAAPHGIAVDQLRARVYVSLGETNRVAVLNALTGNLSGTFSFPLCTNTPVGPWGIAVHPLTGTVYIACYSANRLIAFDGATGSVIASALMGGGPIGVAVDPLSNLVYVSQFGASEIRILNATTLARVSSVRTGIRPGVHAVTVDPILHRVWAANFFDGTVQEIIFNRVVSTVGGFDRPMWLTYDIGRDRVWIPESGSDRVTMLDPLTGQIFPIAISGFRPTAVVANPLGFVYSANFGSLTVTQIFN